MSSESQNVRLKKKKKRLNSACRPERLTWSLDDLRQRCCFGPSAHPQPHNHLSFYSVGRKSLSKAYFFFLPPPHLNEVLNLQLFIPGQIVATLSGACWTRGTAGITGRRGGSPALMPRAESHSRLLLLFKNAFWEFPKIYPGKGPSLPYPLPSGVRKGQSCLSFCCPEKATLGLKRGLS